MASTSRTSPSISLTTSPSRATEHCSAWVGLQPVIPLLTTTPRLGIDYFLTRNFTLGGNLGFSTGGTETVLHHRVRVRIAGRLRAALGPFGVAVAARWLHLHDLFYADSNLDYFTFGLTVEAPFVFALSEGFALTAGPNLDLGFLAERESRDATETVFGLMFGLSGWLNL